MSTRRGYLVVVVAMCFSAVPSVSPALADNDPVFMGDCKDDGSIAAQNVIVGCDNFISQSMIESWNWQYQDRALYYQAKAYVRVQKYEKARDNLLRAIKLEPNRYPEYWSELGEVLDRIGPAGQMSGVLDAMIKANPDNAAVLNEACWARVTHGEQLDAALADCNEALRLAPNDAAILDSRCFVRFQMGQYENAVADCDAALRIEPKMASALYVRGLADIRMGYADLGKTDVAAATSIKSNIADEYAGYGAKP